MAKRKKRAKQRLDVAMTLPIPVLRFCQEVAKVADVPIDDVLNVILAIEVVRRGIFGCKTTGSKALKTASEMTMEEVCAELRRRNELQPIGDNFLLDLANRLADTSASPQAPIVSIWVGEEADAEVVEIYAPGLPPGTHELYCEPESTAPYLRVQPSGDA